MGVDASGPVTALGATLELVDYDDGALAASVASILEGFPLANVIAVFESAAIAMAVGRRNEAWAGLKWLVLLNQNDPANTTSALRERAAAILERSPEVGVHPALPARVSALLLWLTGDELDDKAAGEIDPGLENSLEYAKDYLARPSHSFFALERRHADEALLDTSLRLIVRVQRTRELWFDPTFEPPQPFVDEVRSAAAQIDVDKLDGHAGVTIEDHVFEELEPALARCAPDILVERVRRKMRGYPTRKPEERYSLAIHATSHFVVVGPAESTAARALRVMGSEATLAYELYAASQLLIVEVKDRPGLEQAESIVDANPEEFLTDVAETLRPLSSDDADRLIDRYGGGSRAHRRHLLFVLANGRIDFSSGAWQWLTQVAFGDDIQLRGIAHKALATSDPMRFGSELFARDWKWSATANHWENTYGTEALIGGTGQLPFDQVAPRLAPWGLLEAARRRGADPTEVRLACTILGRVLDAKMVEDPDPGASLSVDRSRDHRGLFRVSASEIESEIDSMDTADKLRRALDVDSQVRAHQRAAEIAVERIRVARESGADLYLVDIRAEDLEIAILHCPDLVDVWLEGLTERTSDFRRRVHLAEGAFLALCEALLKTDAERGVSLFRALRETLSTHFSGAADADELLHIAFRSPDSSPVVELRKELASLTSCHSDQALLNLAIAARFNDKGNWLDELIADDELSELAWRRKRAAVLRGFTVGTRLPIADAWPQGEIETASDEMRRKSGRYRYSDACARHWWREYWAAEDSSSAYAAWVLFLRSADRRAWVWIGEDWAKDGALRELKMRHFRLNRLRLERAMEKREEKLDKEFLGRDVVDGVGPWG